MTKKQPQFLAQFLDSPQGRRLAYRRVSGADAPASAPGVIWLGGFASDMDGTKASFLAAWAHSAQVDFLRFDYSGCGLSPGDFYQGNISRWRDDAASVFDQLTQKSTKGRQLVIASSMGAWIALHLAREPKRAEKIAAMILIAPAPDFTHKLLSEKFRQKIIREGELPKDHPSGPLSRGMIEDAQTQLIMNQDIQLACPVHILHGLADDVVPLSHVLELIDLLKAPEVSLTAIKNADHRLSEPNHLQCLKEMVEKTYQDIDSHS